MERVCAYCASVLHAVWVRAVCGVWRVQRACECVCLCVCTCMHVLCVWCSCLELLDLQWRQGWPTPCGCFYDEGNPIQRCPSPSPTRCLQLTVDVALALSTVASQGLAAFALDSISVSTSAGDCGTPTASPSLTSTAYVYPPRSHAHTPVRSSPWWPMRCSSVQALELPTHPDTYRTHALAHNYKTPKSRTGNHLTLNPPFNTHVCQPPV
jgi:hypothetical protein